MSIATICAQGDPLERHMFADGTFSSWFNAYASVWENHVLPWRGVDGLVSQPWREFAQRNYTAIVRCWNAWTLMQRIDRASADGSVEAALLLHADVAGFFAMSRSAIENLHRAFVDRKIKGANEWAYVDTFGPSYPNVGWLRHIRNDLLHNRLLPIDHRTKPATIDRSLLPTDDQDKNKPWHTGVGPPISLVTMIGDVWAVFPQQMNSLWKQLDGELGAPAVGSGYGSGRGVGVGMGHGSGVGASPHTPGGSGSGSGTGSGLGGMSGIPPSGITT